MVLDPRPVEAESPAGCCLLPKSLVFHADTSENQHGSGPAWRYNSGASALVVVYLLHRVVPVIHKRSPVVIDEGGIVRGDLGGNGAVCQLNFCVEGVDLCEQFRDRGDWTLVSSHPGRGVGIHWALIVPQEPRALIATRNPRLSG